MICCIKLPTKKHGVHAEGPGKIVNFLGLVDAILDHQLPKPNIDTSDQSSVESGLDMG